MLNNDNNNVYEYYYYYFHQKDEQKILQLIIIVIIILTIFLLIFGLLRCKLHITPKKSIGIYTTLIIYSNGLRRSRSVHIYIEAFSQSI